MDYYVVAIIAYLAIGVVMGFLMLAGFSDDGSRFSKTKNFFKIVFFWVFVMFAFKDFFTKNN